MEYTPLDDHARRVMLGNDRGGYTVPTDGLYPYQWNWDSAFAAWGFAQFDVDRAWDELNSLMASQWRNGMVPHIIFHKPDPSYFPGPDVWKTDGRGPVASSGISQPPVAATFARAVYDRNPETGFAHIQKMFPRLVAWHRWFMEWRNDAGAIFVTHPWESGRDNCPDWDDAMAMIQPDDVGEYVRRDTTHVNPEMRPTKADYDRYVWLVQRGVRLGWDEAAMAVDSPFKVADPTMTFILLRAHRDLAEMADILGEDRREIDCWIAEVEAGAERLKTDDGTYSAINLRTQKHTGHISSASFLCWYAGVDSDAMMDELEQAFAASDYPVPSHKLGTDEYDAKRYWRGPTWGIINTLIGMGLHEMGKTEQAERLRKLTRDLIARHGFAEYFNPETGDPAGGGTFTWTAAIWLAWASPSAGEY